VNWESFSCFPFVCLAKFVTLIISGSAAFSQYISVLFMAVLCNDFRHDEIGFPRKKPDMQRSAWNRRLLASTRGRILALLRAETRTVSDLMAALQLTDNAVRGHLLSLERDGLVQQRGTRPGKRKPHVAYGLSPEAEHIFPKAYGPLLNHLLAAVSKRLTARGLRGAMHEVGAALAADHLPRLRGHTRRERIKAAIDLFNELGGSAVFDQSGGKQFIYGRDGCPLGAVSARHPEACFIIESMVSKVIGSQAKKCCEYGEAPRCCFELIRK
jgi:predicted ArsR family transcriptional regulator